MHTRFRKSRKLFECGLSGLLHIVITVMHKRFLKNIQNYFGCGIYLLIQTDNDPAGA
jgi:hypothetical protein